MTDMITWLFPPCASRLDADIITASICVSALSFSAILALVAPAIWEI